MEIIGKQVEKVKEVPADNYGYNYGRRDINGKANAGLTLGIIKSTRDGFDVLSAKQNQDAFNLYKSQRDSDDEIRKELSDLKAQAAINVAVRPYQDKLIHSPSRPHLSETWK